MAKSKITIRRDGKEITLSQSEVKEFIMKGKGLTEKEYKSLVATTRNKLRAYEAFSGARKQSATSYLYYQTRAERRKGYKPTIARLRIEAMPNYSTSRLAKVLKSPVSRANIAETYASATYSAFARLIEANPTAKRIYDEISDPVKRENALVDFAQQLHAEITERGTVRDSQAIPYGETFGSGDAPDDFDIEKYL